MTTMQKHNCDESNLKEAYEEFCKFKKEHPEVNVKGLSDFLKEDPTLTEKIRKK